MDVRIKFPVVEWSFAELTLFEVDFDSWKLQQGFSLNYYFEAGWKKKEKSAFDEKNSELISE